MKTDKVINGRRDRRETLNVLEPRAAAEAFGVMLAVHELMEDGVIDIGLTPMIADRSVELADQMVSGKTLAFNKATNRYEPEVDDSTLTVEV